MDRPLEFLDVGSMDVNGTCRTYFDGPFWDYATVDLGPGRGVDRVPRSPWRGLPCRHYDVIISSQTAGTGCGSGPVSTSTTAAAGPPRILFAPRDLPPLRPDVSEDVGPYRDLQAGRVAQRRSTPVPCGPSVAVVTVLEDPNPGWLRKALQSVVGQTMSEWELAIGVVGDLVEEAEEALTEVIDRIAPGRAHVTRHPAGWTTPLAAAAALAASTAEVVALMSQDDQLAPDCLELLTAALEATGTRCGAAYADEDRIDGKGDLSSPVLKPGWSPELLLATPYLGHPLAVRRVLFEEAGGFQPVADGDWEHDVMLRIAERRPEVAHVAEVLCHRRFATGAAVAATTTTEALTGPGNDDRSGGRPHPGPGAVVRALERRGEAGLIEAGPIPGSWTVRRVPSRRPRVTAIIPFRDGATLLRACVDSVTGTAGAVDLDLVLVDNGSAEPETLTLLDRLEGRRDVTVLHDDRAFNWAALNNAAAQRAAGEVLLFLNNDIEARRPGWLEALAAQALRPEVGAAGARLLYPSGRVQHVGLALGLGGAAGHVLAGLPGDQPGYLGMAVLQRECSAVTGACLATRRTVFDDLQGFDESLGLDLNDIDYCLRGAQRGLRTVLEPAAELVHYESPSRGTSGSREDIRRFLDRWESQVVAGDPFLSPWLTRVDCSCALRGPDEAGWWQAWRSTLERS
ncbi:MAG TPA: glycosyltransferase [Acidimicrobiales bacterium]|nr:glycosyltransferase [Acidimicrobiales bacterium]